MEFVFHNTAGKLVTNTPYCSPCKEKIIARYLEGNVELCTNELQSKGDETG